RFRCDEMSCHNCTAFSCGQADKCLSRTQLCDGRADCRDGRDESPKLCASSRPNAQACKSSEFRCGDGPCVAQTYRCDNWKDCADGSDEVDCDQNECAVDNGGCSHGCRDLPLGFICECPRDMVLVGEYQCEEVDACLDADVCDQVCIPANGSLTCGCHQDYKMSPTTGECKAKGDEARVVFTSSQGLRWTSISGGESGEPAQQFPGPGLVVGLAANGTLYWAPQGCGTIYRVSMNERNGDPLPALRVQGPVSGLAVDWIHRLLYWASAGSGSVHVGLLDGSAQRALVAGLQTPSAVAVDPLHRLLFWAQSGDSPKIERSGLDGRDRKALVTHSIRHPVALSLDLPRQLLYWADQGAKTISRVNFEGRHRRTVVESNGYLDRPFGLAVFEGFVYWSDAATGSICRASKHHGRNFTVLLSNANSPGGVAIVQSALQPEGT
uniref:EGF-like domain-containing protein n=1 Tax=Tetraodon nigroviridis TaxID=99883 RepID=H3CXH4_TETNG